MSRISKQQITDRLLNRAVERIYPDTQTLQKLLSSGKTLNVYQGFDPTADTLHIGHTVGMRKLRDFQALGHNVTFLIGDFTARVGDPSDKTATRQQLTKQQVEKNMQSFKAQASKILDFDDKSNPIKIRYNSEWLEKLTFQDILELASEFTVQQMIKRDMFQKRLKTEKPIHIHEFMYPLMQAYDSMTMDTDVEVGGNDQTFNMLAGRQLTQARLKKEKVVVSCKLLTDTTGHKMGKTEGNMIMLSDSPSDIYGKVMAFPDTLIIPAFEILTDAPMTEIENMNSDIESSKANPMDLKKKLAFTITQEHKGEKEAQNAQKHFEAVIQQQGPAKDQLEKLKVDKDTLSIIELLTTTKLADSNSSAKRLIDQGAVSVNGKKIKDKQAIIEVPEDGVELRSGRKSLLIVC